MAGLQDDKESHRAGAAAVIACFISSACSLEYRLSVDEKEQVHGLLDELLTSILIITALYLEYGRR